MLHDEQKYPDPFAFKPERWLTEDGKLNPDLKEPSAIFGFGRRCVHRAHKPPSSPLLIYLLVVPV